MEVEVRLAVYLLVIAGCVSVRHNRVYVNCVWRWNNGSRRQSKLFHWKLHISTAVYRWVNYGTRPSSLGITLSYPAVVQVDSNNSTCVFIFIYLLHLFLQNFRTWLHGDSIFQVSSWHYWIDSQRRLQVADIGVNWSREEANSGYRRDQETCVLVCRSRQQMAPRVPDTNRSRRLLMHIVELIDV